MRVPRVLVIDSYDSFVYNLVQYLGELGAEPIVVRNDQLTVEEALALWPRLMETGLRLGSPGCVHPDRDWMKAFMKGVDEKRLRVDFVTVHSYGGLNADALMQRVIANR